MKIAHIDIQNFRKLKSCRLELAETNTILVGANNSGKTSAMDALIMFLKKSKRKELSTTDITLSNWGSIEQIGTDWLSIGEGQQQLRPVASLGPGGGRATGSAGTLL